MYGMVNSALSDLLTSTYGEAVWQKVRSAAGVSEDVFIATEGYPDEITYQLVGAASKVLEQPETELLKQFGRWWVLKTARAHYGHMLKSGGLTMGEFLRNLPNFHTRVAMIFPKLRPPTFECTDIGPNELRLHYRSHRPGLSPFMIGLLEGLAEMFSVILTIDHEDCHDEGGAHDVFQLHWSEAGINEQD
jgi:hypothetical protein